MSTGKTVIDETGLPDQDGAAPGEYMALRISDNGTGMDAEAVSHVFEPFFTTKPTGKGTGLGLATVYGIVKQNRGTIQVASSPEHGTVFTILLPRCAERDLTTQAAARPRPRKGNGESILLVEDDLSVLKVSTTMLERLGYKVILAPTPSEALVQMQTHADLIRVVLTDIVMPELNVRELLVRLRAINPDVKVVFMSGYTADVISSRGVLDEDTEFLPKPFSIRELASALQHVLGQS